ncbi:WecB/TagA/CpsF family glycosyltransferase [Sinorhizobium psoraleae]|uniref:WecB/TagA/CpsF family glycosyltransferase n=1 Tax=Sinorhizobium psoraleae TaxID=520838 RepID=A0ABT4KH51_9HYPH|nr:WecB/TagA/CpsF family glycosyltransferase [Sinorhizobium psoraleae]MCZ4090282.1 WecB/TagA/CpsF family glycosyltransferase [Sinorhizobium psoraleae]
MVRRRFGRQDRRQVAMNALSRIVVTASKQIESRVPSRDFGWADALAFADTVASQPTWHAVVTERMFPTSQDAAAFVPALLTYIEKPMRVALIGSHRDVVERAAENFRSHAPWHEFIAAGGFSGQGNVLDDVRALEPHILLVAIESSKQEKWVDRNIALEHGRLVIAVDDFVVREFSPSPALFRRLGLFWLHRFAAEAGRRRAYHAFRWKPIKRGRDLAGVSEQHFESPQAHRGASRISRE